ncbi:hypothetical protein AXG93_3102s1240 [Marchantia polymorpha subsp. ruderalis]|uniref:Triosephosphate isomerase n=1 Tax=Marchantia polymorpha subsp. ruderalis TaxID=1480154 RepID=A0A176W864_MARPO|nr:hypothetical protein AXG93_3102s1240 [Marchantia polymorpha subsp. ruderalis]
MGAHLHVACQSGAPKAAKIGTLSSKEMLFFSESVYVAGHSPSQSRRPTMSRKLIVGGNWKCNGTQDDVKRIVEFLNKAEVPCTNHIEVVIAPPAPFLPILRSTLRSDFNLAAQNCWTGKGGAFTGEISAEMLMNLNVPWVILGHSERRTLLGESDEVNGRVFPQQVLLSMHLWCPMVAEKVAYALSQGMKVILCCGETLEQREKNETTMVVARQIKAVADKIQSWNNVVIAYEPIWAIGTGKVATPQQAQEVHANIRAWLSQNVGEAVAQAVRIQYGGSVTAANCKEIGSQPDVDGFLVGGASLKPEFADILNARISIRH